MDVTIFHIYFKLAGHYHIWNVYNKIKIFQIRTKLTFKTKQKLKKEPEIFERNYFEYNRDIIIN